MDDIFTYCDLDDPSSQIRILKIIPGDGDIMNCSLEQTELSKRDYTCLSYCWGDDDATFMIRVNGLVFNVRSNLYEFLRTARALNYGGPLWIDAISINQADNAEKSIQVALMGQIYRLAIRTIIWLGHPLDHLDVIYDLCLTINREGRNTSVRDSPFSSLVLSQLCSQIRKLTPKAYSWNVLGPVDVDETGGYKGPEESARLRKLAAERVMKHEPWIELCVEFFKVYGEFIDRLRHARDAVDWIMSNKYWTRAWVVQEFVVTPSAEFLTTRGTLKVDDVMELPNIYCDLFRFFSDVGQASMLTELVDLFSDPANLRFNSDSSTPRINLLKVRRTDFWAGNIEDGLTLNEGLGLTMDSGCTDVRDRVFSIQSFLSPRETIKIDYSMSREQLFLEVMTRCVVIESDGQNIFFASRELLNGLGIVPEAFAKLCTLQDLLEDLKALENPTGLVKWANPGPVDDGSSAEDYGWDQEEFIGLYISVDIGSSRCLVLEYIFQLVESSFVLEFSRHPRVFIIEGGEYSCYEGEEVSFSWPELDRRSIKK